jgi:VanZ family protein
MTDGAVPRVERRKGSPMVRAALVAYLLLIVYASWFPFTGWRSTGLEPWTFLNLAPQRYWTGFDVAVNVIGYVPLGMLIVPSVYPKIRGAWAVLLTAIVGMLVSGAMEAVQTFLPSGT